MAREREQLLAWKDSSSGYGWPLKKEFLGRAVTSEMHESKCATLVRLSVPQRCLCTKELSAKDGGEYVLEAWLS